MNIVDTNGISHMFATNLTLQRDYYLAPDVVEEVEMTQLVHGRRIPHNVFEISQTNYFDEVIYLEHYNKTLNKYGGRSFYNMTGFGDVSIIATIYTLLDIFDSQRQGRLFDVSEQVVVYTNDAKLTAKISTEFAGRDVVVRSVINMS